jgi:hypothetical protein
MRLAQAFQPCLANTLGEPKEPRLHVSRKGGNFSGDGVVQDFNSPGHGRLYLNFKIGERGRRRSGFSGFVALVAVPGRPIEFVHSATANE